MKYIKSTGLFSLVIFMFSMFVQCYGNFPLVKAVYQFNGTVASRLGLGGIVGRLINNIVMIIPLIVGYIFGFLFDIIILNSIEFWTGNPVTIGHKDTEKHIAEDGSTAEISYHNDGKTMEIKSTKVNENPVSYYLFRDKPGKFFSLINGKYVEIEMNKKEKDADHFEIVYKTGTEVKSVTVEKTKLFALENRITNIYALVMQKHGKKTIASIPSASPVH